MKINIFKNVSKCYPTLKTRNFFSIARFSENLENFDFQDSFKKSNIFQIIENHNFWKSIKNIPNFEKPQLFFYWTDFENHYFKKYINILPNFENTQLFFYWIDFDNFGCSEKLLICTFPQSYLFSGKVPRKFLKYWIIISWFCGGSDFVDFGDFAQTCVFNIFNSYVNVYIEFST